MSTGVWCLNGPGAGTLEALLPLGPSDGTLYSPTLPQLAVGLVGVGICVVATSLLGCWAAVKEARWGLAMVSGGMRFKILRGMGP